MSDKNTKKADIIAVAKRAKVSPSTVSRSFNHPELVKASTRKKIDSAIRKLGYIRNRAAQTIHGIRSGTIGLIVPTIDQTIFAELIQSFSESVEDRGFTILLASHGYNLAREYDLTRKMLEHRVDGIALIGLEHSGDTYELLAQQAMPAILLWNHSNAARLPCVGSDNDTAGYLIGAHVGDLGHKRIAAVFPPLDGNERASMRFEGVLRALTERGGEIPDKWRLETPYSVSSAKAEMEQLIAGPERPDAIICGNDVLAWGVMHAMAKARLRVPEDISVTGIGDFKGSKDFEPGLTTVRIPAKTIGEKAAEAISVMITTNDTTGTGAMVPPELMVRASCARAK